MELIGISNLNEHFLNFSQNMTNCPFQGDPPDEDVVSCIFLVPNGSSSSSSSSSDCPLFVNSYRCDSAETAEVLASQLQAMVDRPENRRKYDEIEAR